MAHLRDRAAGLSRRVQAAVPCHGLGSEYGRHAVCTERLGPDSIIYSFGLGEDISFDLELIDRTGATVYGFDPTPRSIAWVKAQALPDRFVLAEYGLAAHDGVVRFHAPADPTHISHSLLDERSAGASATIEVEVRRLATIMREHGHERLDVLKIDIEGAEYDVLDQLLDERIPIDQLLIEFHHQFASIPARRTADTLARLHAAGYRVFHVAENLREFSLLRTGP
ncbi:MAG: FkbM family methyltransferase [Deltaproteobacteria bacterium]|nr:FkbM family methyltransferase [Nannocystaceae bacterium]